MIDQVIHRCADGVAELRFNRPEKKNAILGAMYTAMADGLSAAEGDDGVRAIVIGGEGDAFTAGNDLSDFLERPPSGDEPPVRRFMRALAGAQKPVVAAVNGLAIGIGTTLLLHCDLVVASTRARLQLPFVNLGIAPEFASSLLLPARIGRQRAAEMVLLGEALDAATALAFGLVNRVVEPEVLEETAMDLARRLAAKPLDAIRQSKRLMADDPALITRRMAEEDEVWRSLLSSPDAREAFQAFLTRRKPESRA